MKAKSIKMPLTKTAKAQKLLATTKITPGVSKMTSVKSTAPNSILFQSKNRTSKNSRNILTSPKNEESLRN